MFRVLQDLNFKSLTYPGFTGFPAPESPGSETNCKINPGASLVNSTEARMQAKILLTKGGSLSQHVLYKGVAYIGQSMHFSS